MTSHIELGHALITMVEPHAETIVEYNRWYEHDHFLSGVLTGPGAFAGRRFVATRELKELRFPQDSAIARPLDAGSFITMYWIEHDQLGAHCAWGFPEAARLAGLGRMNPNRRHISTAYYDLVSVRTRGARDVPVELALHRQYDAVVMVWTAPTEASSGSEASSKAIAESLVADGSPIEQVVSFAPVVLPDPLPAMPGVIIDGAPRSGLIGHCAFVDREIGAAWSDLEWLVRDAVDRSGDTEALLVAPFIPTVPGTDTYLDRLW